MVKIWEVNTGKLVKSIKVGDLENDIIFHVTYSKDGRKIVASLNSGKIKILDVNDDYEIQILSKKGNETTATSAQLFGENNKYLVSTSWDQSITIW